MFVSVTRLHLRRLLTLLQFMARNEAAIVQVRQAQGFLSGKVYIEGVKTFWTITVWQDEKGMKAYRGAGVHRDVMPLLFDW
ncbi:MAG: hypothetical protein WKF37_06870, partial [Bryobacteraceae bacterium]